MAAKLDGFIAAQEFFRSCFAGLDRELESLWVAHVDDEFRCLHLAHYPGGETGLNFPLRSTVSDVLEHGSTGILLAHNHPSGDARPSDSDQRATRRLVLVAETLDCCVLDHLIFAGSDCTSFRRIGLL